MPIPERYHLDQVFKLRGDALVTFPGASLTVKKVERAYTVPRGTAQKAYLTADTEHTTALLTEQYIIGGDQQHVNIYELYETLPGVDLIEHGVDPETLLQTRRITRRVASNAHTDLAVGDPWPSSPASGWIIMDVHREPASAVVTVETFDLIDPEIDGFTRTEQRSIGFQFPAVFVFLTVETDPPGDSQWAIPNPPWTMQGPFPGIDYELVAHRSASKPAEAVYSYSLGPSGSVPNTWTVWTPGQASRIFPISGNTVHNEIKIWEWANGGLDIQMVENIPESGPNSYSAGVDDCIIQSSEERWRGNIFRKAVLTVTE